MFTGLIEEVGTAVALRGVGQPIELELVAPRLAEQVRIGDSVAVNGCCLTVARRDDDKLSFDILRESLDRTNLRALQPRSRVNLELALAANERLGGHFVQGHVDRAVRMRKPPDLFELRLDRLINSAIGPLPAPLIITARDPREGGANNLSAARRRALLLEFLPRAAYVDVELRAARALRSVLEAASENKVRTILSFHDFDTTPPAARPAQ